MPVPHNPDDGRARRGRAYPAIRRPRRDLRFAAVLSVGLIGLVLLAGAAIAPLVATNSWPSFQGSGEGPGVQLGDAPAADQTLSERSATLPLSDRGGAPLGRGGVAGAPVVAPAGAAP